MYQFSSNNKCCITCNYWEGERRPNMTVVTTENCTKPGKCYLVFVQGTDRIPLAACPSWQKWSALK